MRKSKGTYKETALLDDDVTSDDLNSLFYHKSNIKSKIKLTKTLTHKSHDKDKTNSNYTSKNTKNIEEDIEDIDEDNLDLITDEDII